ncbi:ABC transporter permease [Catenulispora pinisilvae]|uniref:ABC transporter permease n=1 Tax=Catenulispora pinisilvae TaxID=2705253 RepID=UPI0018925ACA|nr:ABC transporter permease [Catenulispora pinisilvae]
MSSHAFFADSATMTRRSLRQTVRYPVMMISSLVVPIILFLLFAGVFSGSMKASVAAFAPGTSYVDYIVPGIVLMTVGYGSSTTALRVNSDMTSGIMARLRTMRITRTAVLTGHVIGAVIRTLIAISLVLCVAALSGLHTRADALAWLGLLGVISLLTIAITWLSVAIGLAANKPEGTSGFTLLVQVLPFISSAFVPIGSLSGALRWFARNEPFTPIIDTIRGLLLGMPIGHSGWVAVAWCSAMALGGYFWSRALFNRGPSR